MGTTTGIILVARIPDTTSTLLPFSPLDTAKASYPPIRFPTTFCPVNDFARLRRGFSGHLALVVSELTIRHRGVISTDNGLGHLPNLKKVVLSSAADDPGVVEIPAEIGQVIGVPSMHKE